MLLFLSTSIVQSKRTSSRLYNTTHLKSCSPNSNGGVEEANARNSRCDS